jgi:hypothetical protein
MFTRSTYSSNRNSATNRQLDYLYNIIYSYNANINTYNRNVENLIVLLNSEINRSYEQTQNHSQPRTYSQPRTHNEPRTYSQPRVYRAQTNESIPLESLFSNILNANSNLTSDQIANATRRINYDISLNETRCPISLEDFEIGEEITQIIRCGHFFKTNPLIQWLRRNSYCPVCRCNLYQSSGNNQSNDRLNTLAEIASFLALLNQPSYDINASYTFEIPVSYRQNRTSNNNEINNDDDSVD